MRTSLLLDTCAVLYVAEDRLSSKGQNAMNEAYEERIPVRVSAITAWEIGLLASRGRLPTTAPPLRFFNDFTTLPGIQAEALSAAILVESSFLPEPIHRDPADRLIVATARALDLTILTSDRLILEYAARGHVRALAC